MTSDVESHFCAHYIYHQATNLDFEIIEQTLRMNDTGVSNHSDV